MMQAYEVQELTEQGKALIDFQPDMETEMANENTLYIDLGGGYGGSFRLLAWGDFNHDAIEDVMLRVYYYTAGTLFHLDYRYISRFSTNGLVRDITPEVEQLQSQLPSAWARQPSFNCGLAGVWAEHSICETPALIKLDLGIASAYARLRATLPNDESQQLQDEQRSWLVTRDTCETETDALSCLEEVMLSRLLQLTRR